MTLELPLFQRPGDYIDGRFTSPTPADAELTVLSPAHRTDCIAIHSVAIAHVDRAVDAARRAFPGWRRSSDASRREVLRKYQEQLRTHREAIALTIALEVGKPMWEARTEVDAMITKVDVSLGEGARFTAPQAVDGLPGEIRYRPLGVLAVIGPFNFPGHLPNGQIVPALLLGNCVVHKPSERTPSAAVWIARCLHEAGLPAGVFNLVQGGGAAGQRLSVHPDVDGVLFTGSAAIGQRIVQDNAAHPERLIALELGGKNAAIALDDCELERTARAVAFAAYATSGQRCTSTSRLIALPAIAPALTARIAELAEAIAIGHPLDADVFMGPVITQQTRDALSAAQQRALAAGYEALVPGGPCSVPGRDGFYVRPSLLRPPAGDDVQVEGYSDSELFAPDLCVHVARDVDHALELANRSRYGLAASVFTRSRASFERIADELRVGVVHWNRSSAGASGRLPFGGIKESGNHRPAGVLTGTTCAYPQGLLMEASDGGALPTWPGFKP